MIKVLICTPVRIFGEALASCLESFDQFDVCATVFGVENVVECLRCHAPDVILLDARDPREQYEARMIARDWPDLAMVALALPDEPAEVISCAEVGFRAYIPPGASPDELCSIVHSSIRGELSCSPQVAHGLIREIWRRAQAPAESPSEVERLTRRERDVLRFVSRGLSNKEIAREMSLSVATVKNHVHHILSKLHVARREDAVGCLRAEPWRLA